MSVIWESVIPAGGNFKLIVCIIKRHHEWVIRNLHSSMLKTDCLERTCSRCRKVEVAFTPDTHFGVPVFMDDIKREFDETVK